ncbi:MAG TPA: Sir2 family NAD-dependent protein deacetylase [Acidimicrobiales bacterium]|nr:Sir2 family NAD-dependent protein deacetylase [Acidimicrobiales bacterium]
MEQNEALEERIQEAREILDTSSKIVVLTGAGVSTDSGIPDFRGPNGVWTKNPEAEKASNIHYYVESPDIRKKNWELRASGDLWPNVAPNLGHNALASLGSRLHLLITQNVDGLHQMAGTPIEKMVEIHGNTRNVTCLTCDYEAPMEEALERVRGGEEDPDCPVCKGLLKSATISFGQSLVTEDLMKAQDSIHECDLLLAVGTSLTVSPINQVVPLAHSLSIPILIINGEKTEYEALATLVLHADISSTLQKICE